jgi:hypothetical protein
MRQLEEAKKENRMGYGTEASAKAHLKKAVKLYRECQKNLIASQKIKGLNEKEEAHLENTLQEVGKQIYWGVKLTTLQ